MKKDECHCEVEERIRTLKRGDHVCMVYENRAEQLSAAIPFIIKGLEENEACLYIADDLTVAEVFSALERRGVNVKREQDKGALRLVTKRDAYLQRGCFDPSEMIDILASSTEQAVREGFSGLRITGEMTWALGGETGCDRLIEYEALLNGFFPGSKALAICQYNRERFLPGIIRDVLRTHPIAVLGQHVCQNLYYEPPEFILSGGNDHDRVSWMIAQLKRNEEAFVERRRAEEKLAQMDRKKDEYIAILAHELRNPLAPIRNVANLLKSSSVSRSQLERCSDIIERQVGHMSQLLEDLLDVSRLTQGKLVLRRETTDLRSILEDAVEACRSQIEGLAHTLTVVTADDRVPVEVDSARIRQVIVNLLDNSIKYTDRGGSILIRLYVEGSVAKVSVKDSGIGLDPSQLDALFEIFYQVENVIQRSRGGLGVGLSIVKGLVQMHGGTVEVRSEGVGFGSEFIISLPLAAATDTAADKADKDETSRLSGYRVLVADDNRDGADSLALMIEMLGGTVQIAYDGEEALRLISNFRPDVAFLDIGMPKLNGYQVARATREDPNGKEIVLVAQTGWGQTDDKRRAVEAGFNHHLVKPPEFDSVMGILEKLMS